MIRHMIVNFATLILKATESPHWDSTEQSIQTTMPVGDSYNGPVTIVVGQDEKSLVLSFTEGTGTVIINEDGFLNRSELDFRYEDLMWIIKAIHYELSS